MKHKAAIQAHLKAHYKGSPMLLHSLPQSKGAMSGKHFGAGEYEAAANWALDQIRQERHTYFTQAVWKPEYQENKKPKKSDLTAARNLHVDLDNVDLEETKQALLDFKLPPSRILYSSLTGVQAFWDLSESVPADQFEELEAANRWLLGQFGEKNVSTVNADRVMRLAGTRNVKPAYCDQNGEFPPVQLVHNDGAEYELGQFGSERHSKRSRGSDAPKPRKLERRIPDGDLREFLVQFGIGRECVLLITHPLDSMPAGSKVNTFDGDRSRAVHRVLCEMHRCSVPEDYMLGIVTDRRLPISSHFYKDRASDSKAVQLAARQIDKTRARAHERSSTTKELDLAELNELHFVCENFGGRTRVLTPTADGSVQNQTFENFAQRYSHRSLRVGKKLIPLGKAWLNWGQRRQFERVVFKEKASKGEWNLYRGFSCEAVPGDCSQFLKIFDLFDHSDWVLNYMAHAVQRPFESPEAAIVFRGGQGVGKTFLCRYFGELFGPHYFMVDSPERLLKNFNAHLMNKLVVFGDEVFATPREAGVLKSMITGTTMTFEPKGVDAFSMSKYFRILLASNSSWVIPADMDDRRFLVLDFSDERKGDHEFFASVDREWRAGGREAFLAYLLERDISDWNMRSRPRTSGLAEQKVASLSPADAAVYEALEAGQVDGVIERSKEGVFVATRLFMRAHEAKSTEERRWGDALKRVGREDRISAHGRRHRGAWLPELGQAREAWSLTTGIQIPHDGSDWAEEHSDF